ncbi:MAG: Ribosomal-protein-S18p-alanine acetyltransferase [uncultured Thermomicrobiales bacterium]|uniref:Ribosomal-protein-S18p-alanine acetyltransferase n=1 Tax=uncultured Thermomicrobiales bacterium TaxID=1645740 RepID=A0A6J4VRR9_9BACT|nr:MAG: Ribosomal-protein-S18p-alanine acetyltransferase [uncultured Thermomicrobiales bacterium]
MSERIVRPYRGAEDLRKMQALVSAAYEQTDMRIGDVAWIVRVHTHRELGLDIRLWEDGGALVGWTFFQSSGGFNLFAAPRAATDHLIDEMLATVEGMAREAIAAGDAMSSVSTYGVLPRRSALDRALASGLERNGFTRDGGDGVLAKELTTLVEPSVPPGYLLATVDTPQRIIGRVEAHRAAFAPSEVTRKMYERVRRTWPYRQELDQIVETESGEVVAFCTAWIDEENAAGLLEPVGTHPNHQRRGLAGAACRAALIALRDAGARTAQVAFAAPRARALYESLGFTLAYDDHSYTKALS